MKSSPVVHFEMPARDKTRMARFYTDAFGWKTQLLGEEMGGYVLATTTESDEQSGRPKMPGAINGGFFAQNEQGSEGTRIVISVEDIQKAIAQVTQAGGKVEGTPVPIPGVGQFAVFTDTEGNRVGLLQPAM